MIALKRRKAPNILYMAGGNERSVGDPYWFRASEEQCFRRRMDVPGGLRSVNAR